MAQSQDQNAENGREIKRKYVRSNEGRRIFTLELTKKGIGNYEEGLMGCKELKEEGDLRCIYSEETGEKRMDWAYQKTKTKKHVMRKDPYQKAPCKVLTGDKFCVTVAALSSVQVLEV